jgi:hypothetical protein
MRQKREIVWVRGQHHCASLIDAAHSAMAGFGQYAIDQPIIDQINLQSAEEQPRMPTLQPKRVADHRIDLRTDQHLLRQQKFGI